MTFSLLFVATDRADAGEVVHDSTWGGPSSGSGTGQFNQPADVDTDAAGNVYVADTANNRIQKFDASGTFLTQWTGAAGTSQVDFNSPRGVTVDGDGNVWVADTLNHRIWEFTDSGQFQAVIGSLGNLNHQFNEPVGIATDAAGNVYVADTNNNRIQKYDSFVNHLATYGPVIAGTSNLTVPRGVEVDSAGNIYISDNAIRVVKLDASGAFVTEWGGFGTGDGQFQQPRRMDVDSADNIYVADQSNHRIQKFTNTGTFLTKWGTLGAGVGEFNEPRGVAVNAQGDAYVADALNHRIQKFAQTGSITIVKDAVPNDAQDFAFTTTGSGLSNFSLDDDADGTLQNTQTFSGLTAGAYSVTETAVGGWPLTALTCDTGESPNLGTRTAGITLAPGEDVTCTFTNTHELSSITIVKDAQPDNAQDFGFTATGTAAPLTHSREPDCAIPDNNATGVSCPITVADAGSIVDVDVSFRIDHTRDSQLDVFLVAPDGTSVPLVANRGGTGQNFGTGPNPCNGTTVYTTVDDAATTPIASGTAPFANTFRPESPLGSLAGEERAGTWNLRVVDEGDGSLGTVRCWRMTTTTATTGLSGFTLDDDAGSGTPNSHVFSGLTAGDYSVTETAVGSWDLSSLVCDTGENPETSARRVDISLETGENVTCTFTNQRRGSITIVEESQPDDAQDFQYNTTGSGLPGVTLDDDGPSGSATASTRTTSNLLPGAYSFTQLPVGGWDLATLSCNTGETVDLHGRGVDITLDPGENVTCTFTNQRRGSITVIKDSVPNHARDFTFSGGSGLPMVHHQEPDCSIPNNNPAGVDCQLTIADPGTLVDIDVGLRISVLETDDLNISLVAPDGTTVPLVNNRGGDGDEFGTGPTSPCGATTSFTTLDDSAPIGIAAGTAPFGNSFQPESPLGVLSGKERAGTWKLHIVDNDMFNLASVRCWRLTTTTDTGAFTLDDDADATLSNSRTLSDLRPGNYSITEAAAGGWDLTGLTCDTGESPDLGNRRVDIAVAPGENVTCTFTNSEIHPGSITVVKDSQPDDPQDFGFSIPVESAPVTAYTDTGCTPPDGNLVGVLCPLEVTDPGSLVDVDVGIRMDHGNDTDLEIALVAPNGTRVPLIRDRGGSGNNLGSGSCGGSITFTTFDDGAATPVSAGSAPFAGSFRPEAPLGNLAGRERAGTWNLLVVDDQSTFTGALFCWQLTTTTATADLDGFDLDDDADPTLPNTDVFAGLEPGEYSVVETPVDDWLTSPSCDAGAVLESRGNRVSIDLAAGEDVTCTFTNTRDTTGSITVVHDSLPDDAHNFSYFSNGTGINGVFVLDDDGPAGSPTPNAHVFENLAPGNYEIAAGLYEDWDLTGLTCDTGEAPDLANQTVAITVSADEDVTCTFTHRKRGSITVVKDAQPDTAQDFTFRTNLPVTHHSETDCAIPDSPAGPVDCPLAITDPGTLSDVNLGIRIAHTFIGDLDIALVAPDGTSVPVIEDVGSSGDNFGTGPNPCDASTVFTTLDDESEFTLSGQAPFARTAQPQAALSAFDGKERAGTWILRITDDAEEDVGTVRCWELTTTAAESTFVLDDDADPTLSNTWTVGNLLPGDYWVSEDTAGGTALGDLTCDTGEDTDLQNRRVDVTVDPGEDVTCTFTNEPAPGSLTIVKDAIPDDPQDFAFTATETSAPTTHQSETDCAIPDGVGAGVDCTLEIPDPGTLVDVDVGMRIDHPFDDDLDVSLVAPDGSTVPLVMDRGDSGDNFGTGPNPCDGTTVYTTLDDAAATAVSAGSAPFAGSFRPESPLGALVGKERAGTWKLHVVDDFEDDAGTVRCWQLTTTTATNALPGFSLDDDTDPTLANAKVFSDLAAGEYSVTETALGGWDRTGLTCDTGERPVVASGRVDITVAPGEEVTCTFTNRKRGSITIVKDARPDDPQDFTFTTTGSGLSGFTLDDDGTAGSTETESSRTVSGLIPGNYSVREGAVAGWQLTNLTCDTGETPNLVTRRVDISVAPGEHVTCTFTNAKDGSITIVKNAVPNDAQDFGFASSGTSLPMTHNSDTDCVVPDAPAAGVDCPLQITDGGELADVNVAVRVSHEFIEDLDISLVAPDGVTTVPLILGRGFNGTNFGSGPNPCDGSTVYTTLDDSAGIDIGSGSAPFAGSFRPESPLSAFAGIERAGTWDLRVSDSANTDVGTVLCWQMTTTTESGSFALDDDADPAQSNSQTFAGLSAGGYSFSESLVGGWDLTGLSCNTGEDTSLQDRRVNVSLSEGEAVTCTFTNTKDVQPDATVAKAGSAAIGADVYNDDGTDQTVQQKVKRKKSATFDVDIVNDGGLSESYLVAGGGSNKKFKVTYLLDDVNVTSAVVAGTQTIGPLAPGASDELVVTVKVKKGKKGNVRDTLITVSSQALPDQSDTVNARVKIK